MCWPSCFYFRRLLYTTVPNTTSNFRQGRGFRSCFLLLIMDPRGSYTLRVFLCPRPNFTYSFKTHLKAVFSAPNFRSIIHYFGDERENKPYTKPDRDIPVIPGRYRPHFIPSKATPSAPSIASSHPKPHRAHSPAFSIRFFAQIPLGFFKSKKIPENFQKSPDSR